MIESKSPSLSLTSLMMHTRRWSRAFLFLSLLGLGGVCFRLYFPTMSFTRSHFDHIPLRHETAYLHSAKSREPCLGNLSLGACAIACSLLLPLALQRTPQRSCHHAAPLRPPGSPSRASIRPLSNQTPSPDAPTAHGIFSSSRSKRQPRRHPLPVPSSGGLARLEPPIPPLCRVPVPPRRCLAGRTRPLPRRCNRPSNSSPLGTLVTRVRGPGTAQAPEPREHPAASCRKCPLPMPTRSQSSRCSALSLAAAYSPGPGTAFCEITSRA